MSSLAPFLFALIKKNKKRLSFCVTRQIVEEEMTNQFPGGVPLLMSDVFQCFRLPVWDEQGNFHHIVVFSTEVGEADLRERMYSVYAHSWITFRGSGFT